MNADLLSVEHALQTLLAAASPVDEAEGVPTLEALDRVLAHDVVSALNSPAAPTSAMDGYALRAADLQDRAVPVRLRVSQRIAAGQVGAPLEPGTAARIFTGAPLPSGADAVVMQEHASVDADHVWLQRAPLPGQAVRPIGEDIAQGQAILRAGSRLSPQALGLAAGIGRVALAVRRRVRVAVFFTGDELAMPGEPLKPGAVYNSNRYVLIAALTRLGCEVRDLGHVPDDRTATIRALQQAAERADLVLTCGGVSVGEEDHVRAAVEAVGRLDCWRLAIKPGKPLAFGALRARQGEVAHFIGLPGNPVSAFVTYSMLVQPFIRKLQGCSRWRPRSYAMRADFDWPKPDKRQEYLRVRINDEGGLDLYAKQNSSALTSTVWGDGLVENPPSRVIARGQAVTFLPFEHQP